MPPCNQCVNPTLCTSRCQAYAEELAITMLEDEHGLVCGVVEPRCPYCDGTGDVHD